MINPKPYSRYVRGYISQAYVMLRQNSDTWCCLTIWSPKLDTNYAQFWRGSIVMPATRAQEFEDQHKLQIVPNHPKTMNVEGL